MDYLDLGFKLLIGFLALIVQINFAGKGNLAPNNAVDQLQNYVLGGIIGGMIYNPSITVLQFLSILLIWTLIVFVTRFMTSNFSFINKVINGNPVTVIHNGNLMPEKAAQNGVTANDLSLKLRNSGVSDIKKVKRAVLETNGQLTVTKFGDSSYNYPVINDGNINYDALDLINKNEVWLMKNLKSYNVEDIYMAVWEDGDLLIYPYGKKR